MRRSGAEQRRTDPSARSAWPQRSAGRGSDRERQPPTAIQCGARPALFALGALIATHLVGPAVAAPPERLSVVDPVPLRAPSPDPLRFADPDPLRATQRPTVLRSVAPPDPYGAALGTLDERAYLRGRRVMVSGLFLGFAGLGLQASGVFFALVPPPNANGAAPWLVDAALFGGSGLLAVGTGLQLAGSSMQGRSLRDARSPWQREARAVGAVGGIGVIAGSSVASLSQLTPERGRGWVGAALLGTAGLGLVVTTVHLVSQTQADERAERVAPHLRVQVGLSGLRVVWAE